MLHRSLAIFYKLGCDLEIHEKKQKRLVGIRKTKEKLLIIQFPDFLPKHWDKVHISYFRFLELSKRKGNAAQVGLVISVLIGKKKPSFFIKILCLPIACEKLPLGPGKKIRPIGNF